MSNHKEIIKRLSKLKEYSSSLKHLKKFSLNEFKGDKFLCYTLERVFHLSAEASIDIGEIIISELDLNSPEFNRDVFRILGEAKIIPKKLADNFQEIAKFRNILVHDYVEIDIDKMYEYLQNDLSDFDKFIKAIAKFLKNN